jgi:hypothetical protein
MFDKEFYGTINNLPTALPDQFLILDLGGDFIAICCSVHRLC